VYHHHHHHNNHLHLHLHLPCQIKFMCGGDWFITISWSEIIFNWWDCVSQFHGFDRLQKIDIKGRIHTGQLISRKFMTCIPWRMLEVWKDSCSIWFFPPRVSSCRLKKSQVIQLITDSSSLVWWLQDWCYFGRKGYHMLGHSPASVLKLCLRWKVS
jgi:hypothetical protein